MPNSHMWIPYWTAEVCTTEDSPQDHPAKYNMIDPLLSEAQFGNYMTLHSSSFYLFLSSAVKWWSRQNLVQTEFLLSVLWELQSFQRESCSHRSQTVQIWTGEGSGRPGSCCQRSCFFSRKVCQAWMALAVLQIFGLQLRRASFQVVIRSS